MTDVALDLLPGPTGAWTVADLMRLPDDGSRQEIIDGSLLVTPPPSIGHQHVAMRLVGLLNEAASSDWVAPSRESALRFARSRRHGCSSPTL